MSAARIGIDIGGTFTDLVAIAADGRVLTHKTASTPRRLRRGHHRRPARVCWRRRASA